MSEALLLVAEGYEQIAAGIRKMVAAQKDAPERGEACEEGRKEGNSCGRYTEG